MFTFIFYFHFLNFNFIFILIFVYLIFIFINSIFFPFLFSGLANRVVPIGLARDEAEKLALMISEYPQVHHLYLSCPRSPSPSSLPHYFTFIHLIICNRLA